MADRLERALLAVRLVAERPDPLAPLGVGELATALGLTLSTASRLAAELDRCGMLERAGGYGDYRLGPAAIRLSGRAASPHARATRFALTLAAQQTGETVLLAAACGERMRVVASVGSAWTLHASADLGTEVDDPGSAIRLAFAHPAGGVRESTRGRVVEVAAPVLRPDGDCVAVLAVRLLVDRARGGVPRARRALAAARRELERTLITPEVPGPTPTSPAPPTTEASSIGRALEVLDVLATEPRTIAAAARAAGIGADRAHRILGSARRAGIVAVEPSGNARISWGVHAWHRAVAEPLMRGLGAELVAATADATGECAFLTVLRGMRSFTLVEELEQAGDGLTMAPWLGRPHPIIGSDGGPTLAMDVDADRLAELLPSRHTPHEIEVFAGRVRRVQRDGVISFASIDDAGLFSISAPVRDASGAVIAAACMVGPVDAMRARVRELEHETLELAEAVSGLLAGTPQAVAPRSSRSPSTGTARRSSAV
ncbi:helix-turn-helix domain-containing protein [Homoserinibacter sp. GY 40078]|uniref:helix-turn-helix domain-containing protein n=1 Tax=Homoserinibacter sp. GY 40078 TaxID=2603275 RepID=UPI0011C7D848|nr:helix-turn-helix domain-containing protein [Homoserinibacter sp. GY 40078]TXK18871.1 helix-turn-helix domain-containing protein [Homoserinibacter sp. GY 40078]